MQSLYDFPHLHSPIFANRIDLAFLSMPQQTLIYYLFT